MRHAHSLLALQAAAAMALLPWGKRPCQDYLKALREQTPARLGDGLVDCHPLRHLRWTAGVAEENEDSSPLPPQLAFDARNSASHAAAAAGVDWTAVLRRARASAAAAPRCQLSTVRVTGASPTRSRSRSLSRRALRASIDAWPRAAVAEPASRSILRGRRRPRARA